ncbi:hypothetical protein PLESTB_000565600 [Pleodorina starrii]|uniref:PDZ domain-containing protein n=1 Tax=Pleodorina starrii TaxID=330485 RepID=A0A9W6F138_9CHLO|nr:hypothetical protein PLESTB_000565600 [Pleodorina starrii]GLC68522.1 hypothetical protein PLESTF_000701300 [Pleodorina starrii]
MMLCRACPGPRIAHGRARQHLRRAAIVAHSVGTTADGGSVPHQQLQPVRAFAPNDDTGGQLETEVLAVPGSRVFTISLQKPLGLVLAERAERVVVESVNAGGHAAAAGVAAGDVLLATSARPQVDTSKGTLRGQLILLATAGEKFSTVTAAIRSNTCSQCSVHLVLERRQGQ